MSIRQASPSIRCRWSREQAFTSGIQHSAIREQTIAKKMYENAGTIYVTRQAEDGRASRVKGELKRSSNQFGQPCTL